MTWALLLVLAVGLVSFAQQGLGPGPEELAFSELFGPEFFDSPAGRFRVGVIDEAVLDGQTLHGRYGPAALRRRRDDRFVCQVGPDVGGELRLKLSTLPRFRVAAGPGPLERTLYAVLPWAVLFVIAYFLFFRPFRTAAGAGSLLSFGRSRARLANKRTVRTTFQDVAGIDEAKAEVQEIVEFLRNPRKFQRLGGRIPRGIILVGLPGTGKTLLAKAIAGEADVPFYSICGSDFVEMFVGVGASRVRDLFSQAKAHAPCIVFLDELDAVGRRRGSGLGGGHDEREQTLNAILVEMDGFDTDEQVIVIAATNRIDVLDPALLRPGRFDREIVIDLPDVRGRLEILQVHARRVKLAEGVDLGLVARSTPTFSGADLAALINEAAIHASMANKDAIDQDDLEEARDKVRWGRAKRSRLLDEADRRLSAYHEAGHALVAKLDPDVEELHKVTIVPRGMTLGATMLLPDRDRRTLSRRQLLGQLRVTLAGRLAEELFTGDVSTGADNDIRSATEIARRMVCEWGMSEVLGPVRYTAEEQQVFLGGEVVRPREHSEETARVIDEEVRKLVGEAGRQARAMIEAHRPVLARLAEALLEREVLTVEEVGLIIEGKALQPLVLNRGAARAPA